MDRENYRFVYQEWDIMRERHAPPGERLEKLPTSRQCSFSMKLQEARIQRRLTIQDLSTKSGIPPKTLSLYENGTEIPSSETIALISAALDINVA